MKWEYTKLVLKSYDNKDENKEFAKLGDDDWELVNVIILYEQMCYLHVAYFKRPKELSEPETKII